MAGGAPRYVSRPPEEMIALGEEMVQWVIDNDPLHLSQWYTIHKGFTYNEWKTFIACREFFPHYEKALKLVGIKYLDGESKRVKQGISERWQRIYFKDLREEEDQTHQEKLDRELEQKKALVEHEMKMKADNGVVDEDLKEGFNAIMTQLSSVQSTKKIARSKSKADKKS